MSDGGHYGMALKGEGGGASTLTAFEVSWRNQWWVAIKVGGVLEWSMCTKSKYESLHNFKSSISTNITLYIKRIDEP